MRRGWWFVFCAGIGLSAGGCDEQSSTVTDIPPLAEVEPKPEPAGGDEPGRVELTVEHGGEHGSYIADSGGRALYLLEGESDRRVECNAACAQVWRPYIAPQADPTAADPEVQENLISTVRRQDGSAQVTYNGHPLYYYVRDLGPGQTTGQDVTDAWGEWYLITPEGRPLEDGQHASILRNESDINS
ncbi:MAG TPA: hypothetical protein VF268_02675 [Gammaproteobacteria bacterium]|jgi:predicted lipoprotein with Yx(FWY)xxD motif